jgi:hypothetical protein
MSSLSEIQSWMHSTLLEPGGKSQGAAADHLTEMAHLDAVQSLSIYQRSYALRLAACMREQFPATCHALGTSLFNDFVETYVAALPPESYTLHDLGRRFPRFLNEQRPDKEAPRKEIWIDFLVDLARFERQVYVAYDCKGVENGGLQLASPETPDNRLAVQPSLTLAAYTFDVGSYFHEVREDGDPKLPPQAPHHFAVLRLDYKTAIVRLSEPHFVFLRALSQAQDVSSALVAVADALNSDVETVRKSWMQGREIRNRWIKAGFFVETG